MPSACVGWPETILDRQRRQRRLYRYELMDTHYQKLTSLPDAAVFLKPSLTFVDLNRLAMATTHHQAAQQLNDECKKLFVLIHRKQVCT